MSLDIKKKKAVLKDRSWDMLRIISGKGICIIFINKLLIC